MEKLVKINRYWLEKEVEEDWGEQKNLRANENRKFCVGLSLCFSPRQGGVAFTLSQRCGEAWGERIWYKAVFRDTKKMVMTKLILIRKQIALPRTWQRGENQGRRKWAGSSWGSRFKETNENRACRPKPRWRCHCHCQWAPWCRWISRIKKGWKMETAAVGDKSFQ